MYSLILICSSPCSEVSLPLPKLSKFNRLCNDVSLGPSALKGSSTYLPRYPFHYKNKILLYVINSY